MADEQAQGQGAEGASQGDEGSKGEDDFDKDRALATIKAQRESEAAAKQEAAAARAELKKLKDEQAKKHDEELSETQRLAKQVAELEAAKEQGDAAARARVAKSALKAAAAAAGAHYPGDVPALVDLAAVKFDGDGDVTNADALVGELKKTRPVLFTERKPGSADGGSRGSGAAPTSMDDRIRAATGRR